MTEVAADEVAPAAAPGPPGRSRFAIIRAIVCLVVAAVCVLLAVVFADHGVRIDTFPAYVTGDTQTYIRQFSGPWITGAFGMVALAGLLVVAAISDLRAPAPAQ